MSQTDLRIRAATKADADVIIANNEALAQETEDRRLDPATVRAGVHQALADPARGVYFLAEREGKIVGQLLLTREWSDWRNGWCWWIQSVYVVPDARRAGVYRTLHGHVETEARRQADVCGVRLYVDGENAAAQRVYERLGMRRSGYQLFEIEWRVTQRGE